MSEAADEAVVVNYEATARAAVGIARQFLEEEAAHHDFATLDNPGLCHIPLVAAAKLLSTGDPDENLTAGILLGALALALEFPGVAQRTLNAIPKDDNSQHMIRAGLAIGAILSGDN